MIKVEKMKIDKRLKSYLLVMSFLFIIALCYKGIDKSVNWFRSNTILFNSPIEVRLNNPIEIVTLEELEMRRVRNNQIDEITEIVIEEYFKPEEATESSLIVKPVKASTTYSQFSKKPYYELIIKKIKELYVDWEYVAEIIGKESGFDPGAINPSSGACGLPQALPCTKMKCSLTDIDCQLNWQKQYIIGRYGSEKKALDFHKVNNWY